MGSTFVVALPLAPATHDYGEDLNRRHPRAATHNTDLQEWPDLEGIKVVVVDDDADARALIKRMFLDSSATVLTASSARGALELIQSERPHVLLSDIGMPGEDGYVLISKVRALPAEKGGRTPAVALTAFARTEDRRKALLSGYQMHVAKPVDAAELMAVIASLANRPNADGEN
jgi:CheY-like chemotaxis protein